MSLQQSKSLENLKFDFCLYPLFIFSTRKIEVATYIVETIELERYENTGSLSKWFW